MVQTECKERSIINFNSELIMAKFYWEKIKEIKSISNGKENDEVRKLKLEISNITEPIKDKIQKGEFTTGDKIKDLVIFHHDFNPDIENKYKELIANLKEHPGELILIKKIEFHQKDHFFSKQEKSEDFIKTEKIQLGIIGPRIKIDARWGRISIADKAVSFEPEKIKLYPDHSNNFEKQNLLLLCWYDFPKTNQPTEKIDPIIAIGNKEPKLEIFVGDRKVKEKLQGYNLDFNQISNFSPEIAKHLKTS